MSEDRGQKSEEFDLEFGIRDFGFEESCRLYKKRSPDLMETASFRLNSFLIN